MKRVAFIFLTICFCLCGCKKEPCVEKVKDLEYTVLGSEEYPETLKEIIEEKKMEPFEISFAEGDYLYLCVGYGEQTSGGYSIQIEDCYLGEDMIYVNTTLLGPQPSEETGTQPSYPVIVIKTEYIDKTIVFE